MTRKEKWQELNPEDDVDSAPYCPYYDMGIKRGTCYDDTVEDISCEECINKEYDESEVAK